MRSRAAAAKLRDAAAANEEGAIDELIGALPAGARSRRRAPGSSSTSTSTTTSTSSGGTTSGEALSVEEVEQILTAVFRSVNTARSRQKLASQLIAAAGGYQAALDMFGGSAEVRAALVEYRNGALDHLTARLLMELGQASPTRSFVDEHERELELMFQGELGAREAKRFAEIAEKKLGPNWKTLLGVRVRDCLGASTGQPR